MFKLMNKKIFTLLPYKCCLSVPMELIYYADAKLSFIGALFSLEPYPISLREAKSLSLGEVCYDYNFVETILLVEPVTY